MTGRHFTSYENWLLIKEQGLLPYKIVKPELNRYYPFGVQGIWVWPDGLSKISEMGSVIFQLSTKAQTKIVQLELEYNPDDRLFAYGLDDNALGIVSLFHNGKIGEYEFHPDSPLAHILTKPIPPENVSLVRIYELLDIVNEQEVHSKKYT